ncbi:MAG TPA: hypothetical protein VK324_04260 [Tepidisphaeraceae bacterium]|nr:hypothetical protein [Tepidisphaeraceae bacterium]
MPASPAVVELDRPLGPAGQLLLARAATEPPAWRWFTALPAADREQFVIELDAYVIVLRDDVRRVNGAWQFATDERPRAVIIGVEGTDATDGPLRATLTDMLARHGANKRVVVQVRWAGTGEGEPRTWTIPVELTPDPQ